MRVFRVLRQRVLTALALVAILLPVLGASAAWPFALLSLVMIAAAGWEWGRLNGLGRTAIGMGALLALLCGAAMAAGWHRMAPHSVWWLATFVWLGGGAVVLRGGPVAWPSIPVGVRCTLGVLLLWTAWLAFASARTIGVNFVLSICCIVWAADIAAYFGGRAFGRAKLAPSISPGKSWAGVWSGIVGALALAAVWLGLDAAYAMDSTSLPRELLERLGPVGLLLAVVFLVAMGVVGDLCESLVKRAAGAKDSSRLLPGHGGVLDRIDALLPVFPIALALATF